MTDRASSSDPQNASRRTFLKTSSVAVVGGSLAATLGPARFAHAGADDTINIGLIGCGARGAGAAAQALRTKGNVKLVALGDAFQDRLRETLHSLMKEEGIGDRIDVPEDRQFIGFDAYKNVIGAGVDLVILTSPPGFRPLHFAAAVDAGKHTFMEKPVAVDAPGVRAVLAAAQVAKQKNLAVGVGLQRRHDPQYIEIIQRLRDGAIGDILFTRAYWNDTGVWVRPREPGQTEMEYQMRNWYYFNWLCGDHIVEQHIHNLDVVNWLKQGYPVSAEGMGGRQVRTGPDYGEIFDHHAVEFEYADGMRMFSYCRHMPHCWNSVSEHAHGSGGSSDINAGRIYAKGADEWRYRGRRPNPYQVEHDDLFASIRAGSPYNEAEYGALSTMTSIFGRMATYSGKVLKWDEALASNISLGPKEYAWDAPPPVPVVATPGVTQVI